MPSDSAARDARVEIDGMLDRHAAEALRLEIRRLAKHYGVEISEIRIERPEEKRSQ
jgi:hypothetical protein